MARAEAPELLARERRLALCMTVSALRGLANIHGGQTASLCHQVLEQLEAAYPGIGADAARMLLHADNKGE